MFTKSFGLRPNNPAVEVWLPAGPKVAEVLGRFDPRRPVESPHTNDDVICQLFAMRLMSCTVTPLKRENIPSGLVSWKTRSPPT